MGEIDEKKDRKVIKGSNEAESHFQHRSRNIIGGR
jgi:hypothetical protein